MEDINFNVDNWEYFCSYARWYPDAFLDLIKPERGGLNLHLDQRIYLRVMMRFVSFYGVFPRGYGKTFDEVLASMLTCVFFPEITISLSAQTKENSADLLKDKYNEIIRFYPMLKNEISKANFAKGDALVVFKNGARLDNLANAQSSKGQRRKRMNMEESALINNDTFLDALLPIVEVPRVCVGKYSIVDPEELNQMINYFTTAGYRGSDEYERSVTMVKDMINLQGKMVLGSSFWLPCWYGRGSTKSQIFQKKRDMTFVSFAQNYESDWVGCADNAFININKLMNCRTLSSPVLQNKNENEEFYIGVDVARSQKTSNNQTFIAVIQVKRNKDKSAITSYNLVNLIHISNDSNFESQAVEIKRCKKRYNAKAVVVDANGVGIGLIDFLLKETIDPQTGESLGCFDTLNDNNIPENPEIAEKILYSLKAQSCQNEVVTTFMDVVDGGKFRMLISKKDSDFSDSDYDDMENKVEPYLQTDCLFEEVANLKLKRLNNNNVTIEKVVSKLDKDRVSAVLYTLYLINYVFKDVYVSSEFEYGCFVN